MQKINKYLYKLSYRDVDKLINKIHLRIKN